MKQAFLVLLKRAIWVLPALVGALFLSAALAYAEVVTVEATVKGEAKAGTFNGKTTTAENLKAAQDYVTRYSGAAEFEVEYDIVLKADKTVDSDKSTVTFKAVFFTDNQKRGADKRSKSNWTSAPIKITGVTLKDGKVAKFTFEAEEWYPREGQIVNKGIKGSFDLTKGESSYIATYLFKPTAAVYSYEVTGKVKMPKPGADPPPTEFGDPDIFSPAPLQPDNVTCTNTVNGDQLCLIAPTTVSSGDLLPISIDIGDLNCATVDTVEVTVQVMAFGAELSQPYRDSENPGDFDLTWTGGHYDWVGTASLERVSGPVSAQPVFAIGNVPAGDAVSITVDVNYTCNGQAGSVDVFSSVEVLSATLDTPDGQSDAVDVFSSVEDLSATLDTPE